MKLLGTPSSLSRTSVRRIADPVPAGSLGAGAHFYGSRAASRRAEAGPRGRLAG